MTRMHATPRRPASSGRSRTGSSLVEFVTAIGVLALVGSLGLRLAVQMERHREVQQARLGLLAEARTLRHAFLGDVRRSAGVAPAAGAFRSGPDALVLRLPPSAEAEDVVYHRTPAGIERTLVRPRQALGVPETECLAEDLNQLRFRWSSVGGRTLVEAEAAGRKVVRRRTVAAGLTFGAATRGGSR